MKRSQTILIVTPTMTGGSWVVIEELLARLPRNIHIVVVGLGPGKINRQVKLIRIPYFMFDKLKANYGANIFFNLIYQIPILLISLFAYLFYRPQKVLSNGFTPILSIMLLSHMMGSQNIIYFGSVVEGKFNNPLIHFLFDSLDKFIDYAFVNSQGSYKDLSLIINPKKIIVIEHWTDISPIGGVQRNKLRKQENLENKFIVLYVGKLAPDKSCDLFIDLAASFSREKLFEFWFAGAGSLQGKIERMAKIHSNIRYKGFINDREILNKLFTVADITLTFADETYLARPAIESLACGTPIMVSDKPAIIEKSDLIKIPQTLIPSKIGWLIDAFDISTVGKLIRKIKRENKSEKMRSACIHYANSNHSFRNIIPAVKLLSTKT